MAVRLDQGHNEFGLLFRAITHCSDHERQAVLIEPPDAGETFHDGEIGDRRLDAKAVVEKQRLSEFKHRAGLFPFAGKTIARVFIGDRRIIHHATGVAEELAVRAVQRNRHAGFQQSAPAVTEAKMPDCFRREAPANQIRMSPSQKAALSLPSSRN